MIGKQVKKNSKLNEVTPLKAALQIALNMARDERNLVYLKVIGNVMFLAINDNSITALKIRFIYAMLTPICVLFTS